MSMLGSVRMRLTFDRQISSWPCLRAVCAYRLMADATSLCAISASVSVGPPPGWCPGWPPPPPPPPPPGAPRPRAVAAAPAAPPPPPSDPSSRTDINDADACGLCATKWYTCCRQVIRSYQHVSLSHKFGTRPCHTPTKIG